MWAAVRMRGYSVQFSVRVSNIAQTKVRNTKNVHLFHKITWLSARRQVSLLDSESWDRQCRYCACARSQLSDLHQKTAFVTRKFFLTEVICKSRSVWSALCRGCLPGYVGSLWATQDLHSYILINVDWRKSWQEGKLILTMEEPNAVRVGCSIVATRSAMPPVAQLEKLSQKL